MKHLTEIFAEARKTSCNAFWNSFSGQGYDKMELATAPTELVEYCFKKADAAGWRFLRENGAFEHHEWTFPKEKQDGQPS
jgi:hypothetical protein